MGLLGMCEAYTLCVRDPLPQFPWKTHKIKGFSSYQLPFSKVLLVLLPFPSYNNFFMVTVLLNLLKLHAFTILSLHKTCLL